MFKLNEKKEMDTSICEASEDANTETTCEVSEDSKTNVQVETAEDTQVTKSSEVCEDTQATESSEVCEDAQAVKSSEVCEDMVVIEAASSTEPETTAETNNVIAPSTVSSKASDEPDMAAILERNPRVEKILALEAEVRRQNEQEKLRGKQIRQEQQYIDQMMNLSIEETLHETREEQRYNHEFEERIRNQVYHIHGLSDDKLEGMREYQNAWYQGASFALFFLSLILFILCGVLHGFETDLALFMAFYTAIGGTLLTNGKQQSKIMGGIIHALYLLLFPAMLAMFVCYELNLSEYKALLPILTIMGAVILLLAVASYFMYDPYRDARKLRKKAENYLHDMEKTALKEVRAQEKAFDKQERKRKKQEEKEEKKKKKEQMN